MAASKKKLSRTSSRQKSQHRKKDVVCRRCKNDSLWIFLRLIFCLVIAFHFWSLFIDHPDYIFVLFEPLDTILVFLFLAFVITLFVLSIVHLFKYSEKAFAITSLVISSIFLIFFLIGLVYGMLEGVSEMQADSYNIDRFSNFMDDADSYCAEFCYGIGSVEKYDFGYDGSSLLCFCFDKDQNEIIRKDITYIFDSE